MGQLASRCRGAAAPVVAALGILAASAVPAVAVPAVAVPAASGPQEPAGWTVSLTPDGDDAGVRSVAGVLGLDRAAATPASLATGRAEGTLLGPAHRLAAPTARVGVQLAEQSPAGSAVAVAVRGLTSDGSWTEWTPADARTPAVLDATVSTVQARLVLLGGQHGESPAVRSLTLTAQPGPPRAAARSAVAAPQRVYATREGLAGHSTANGHVILDRDHFVALPSRRGLSSRDSGDYTVKVCADNGRCEWAPVWDVGPWNTTDDYWNGPDDRESWRDLPQGMPQAQAAYQDGYHNGQDQFGRRVRNPAGIDLADGLFWDGLGLRTNSWVTVSYLWDQGGIFGTVRTGMLNVRSGPSKDSPSVGLATEHARVLVECTVERTVTKGFLAKTDRWLRIGPDQYVSATHVSVPQTAQRC